MNLDSVINFDKLIGREVSGVYRIYGEDLFIMQTVVEKIKNKCDNQMGLLNQTYFDNENFNVDQLINICEQIPMFAGKRFVLVRNIEKVSEGDMKKLVAYSKSPSNECVLVLWEKLEGKVFAKVNAKEIECKKLSMLEIKKLVFQEFETFGRGITQDASSLLIEFCLRDLQLIKNEIFKLTYANLGLNVDGSHRTVLEVDDIKKHVFQNEEYSIFEITSSLTKGQGDRAIILLNKMLEIMEFTAILGLISAHFRRMYYSVISEGTDLEIASFLGVKPFAVTNAKSLAKGIKPRNLVNIISLILEIDFSIKNGDMTAENAMYYLVFKIIKYVNDK